MKTVLFRAGSGPVCARFSPVRSGPRSSVSRSCSISGDSDYKAAPIKFELSPSRSKASGEKFSFPAGFSGSGGGHEGKPGRGSGGGGGDLSGLGEYYARMLKVYPGDPLLLRNYAKFLHEVAEDLEKAGEYYARAILASEGGGDGEVLALYGKLIWETQRDEERAKHYFDKAVVASPHDCNVWGSYAQFMWESEEEEDDSMQCHATLVV